MEDFGKRVGQSVSEMDLSLKRNFIQMRPILSFPKRKPNGLLIRIFLWVFKKMGGIADLKFYDLKTKHG